MTRTASRRARLRERQALLRPLAPAAARTRRWAPTAAASLLALSACGSYIDRSPIIREALANHDYPAALSEIEEIGEGSSRLLYLYEKGLALHYENRFAESNEALDGAHLLYDDLYTKSLSREVAALATSDNLLAYRGERFEAAYVHYYAILNYLHEGDADGALVECRRLNQRLQLFADTEGSPYRGDPFLEYLTGLVYLEFGELNDADVSLRAARDAYEQGDTALGPAPATLYCDLARCAERFGESDAAQEYEAGCARDEPRDALSKPGSARGELNLFLECGYVPLKIETAGVVPIFKHEIREGLDHDDYARTLCHRYGEPIDSDVKLDYLLKIALPELAVAPSWIRSAEVAITAASGDTVRAATTRVADVGALAITAFDDAFGGTLFKTILRGIAKYVAKEKVESAHGDVAGWLTNALNVATERADTRAWSTLPEVIYMARVSLDEGQHDVRVLLQGAEGEVVEMVTIPGVEIARGRSTFLNYRVY